MTPRPCVCGETPNIQESAHTRGFWHVICPYCGAHWQGYGRERVIGDWNWGMEVGAGIDRDSWRVCVRIMNNR